MKILLLTNSDSGLYEFRKEVMEELVKENDVYACLPSGDMIPQIEALGEKCIQDEFNHHGTNPISKMTFNIRKSSRKSNQILCSLIPSSRIFSAVPRAQA